MIIFDLIINSDEVVRYYFYPEGKGKPGIVELNKNTKEITIIEKAEDDWHKWEEKAKTKMRLLFDSNNFPQKEMVAFY